MRNGYRRFDVGGGQWCGALSVLSDPHQGQRQKRGCGLHIKDAAGDGQRTIKTGGEDAEQKEGGKWLGRAGEADGKQRP